MKDHNADKDNAKNESKQSGMRLIMEFVAPEFSVPVPPHVFEAMMSHLMDKNGELLSIFGFERGAMRFTRCGKDALPTGTPSERPKVDARPDDRAEDLAETMNEIDRLLKGENQ